MIRKLKRDRLLLTLLLLTSIMLHAIYGLEGAKQVQAYEYQINRQAAQLKDKNQQIEVLEIIIKNQKQDASEPMIYKQEKEYVGEYTLTAYCSCETCCGKWALNRPNGKIIGAAGIELQEGVSVASPLPFGTKLLINGQEYIVQDRTAEWVKEKYEEKIIDLYFENHAHAEEFGKQLADVWIVEDENV